MDSAFVTAPSPCWKPAYTCETGIEQTIHWYLDNEAWWERIRDGVYRDYYKKQYQA